MIIAHVPSLSTTQIYTHDDDVEILRDATEKNNAALK
jgi:hypothetical protein